MFVNDLIDQTVLLGLLSRHNEKLDLMALRKTLAEQFEKNPHHLYLALEIKAIDVRLGSAIDPFDWDKHGLD